MKTYQILFVLLSLALFSCNDGEGPGGSSSLEGYVYEVRHPSGNSLFPADTFPAVKHDVYIVYGDDDYFGDDIETNDNGFYKFDYLRKGNYTVYAYTTYDDGTRESVSQKVKVSGNTNKADTIFIHTGKANGTSMIRGSVAVNYYDNDRLVTISGQNLFPAIGQRVYLKHKDQDIVTDDVRTDNHGVFVFERLRPGVYEIYTETEKQGDNYKNILFPSESQFIEVVEDQKIYDLGEVFYISINI
ncbi:hypothetical protein LJB98_00205 [Bacteroidales bacterium OttesenSCG-928-M11]|nr:hypothetical protein [Bacteroidales bacterium OttesenSCG-928-M11]